LPTAVAAPCIAPAAAPLIAPARALCTTSVTASAALLTTPFAVGFLFAVDDVRFLPLEEDFAVDVRFDAVEVFLLPAVFGVTFLAGDFAPLVVLRVFAAVDFELPVDRLPPVVFLDDDAVDFLDDDVVDFLVDDAPPELFLEPEVEAFFEVERAPDVDLRAVVLPPDFAPPDRAPPVFALLDVAFLAEEDLALEDVPFLAEDLALEEVPFFAEDPVEPDAFFAVVFLAGDFFAVDAVFDFVPAFEVDFDEVVFLAEVFDEVFFVVAIGPPVIKVLKSSLAK
jgi:hypothetical protein